MVVAQLAELSLLTPNVLGSMELLFTVNCFEKEKNKEKKARNRQFKFPKILATIYSLYLLLF